MSMEKLLRLEEHLIRVESWLLVAMVLTMLLLGSYNVLYRNVLVAWQSSLATSGPILPETPKVEAPKVAPNVEKGKAGSGGFGGGFGDDDDEAPTPKGGGAEGFGGGFGDDDDDDDDAESPKPAQPAPKTDGSGGFGGGFGDDDDDDAEPAKEKPEAGGGFGGGFGDDDDDDNGFGGGFGDDDEGDDGAADVQAAPAIRAPAPSYKAPVGSAPAEGSFAAGMVKFIDAIKLDWIDVLLRQLVIMVGFLGAMIATKRRKHINIDAASKLLPMKVRGWIAMVMNVLATGMSVALAVAGYKLVAISQEFPKELIPHFDEWHMQLMFPVGFGFLALHFAFRALEDLDRNLKGLPPVAGGETADLEREKAAAKAAAAEEAA
jgi:TRAP-type C4-dicarboxylate transport system permease small subunit